MGVPAFYRWLSDKYALIVQDVLEDRIHLAPNSSTIQIPFDLNRPNPSGLECDNFYIDMNGIIHPCSHPENGPQPTCEEDMYENVCRYVDRLMRAARPRKLLYLAIDGVAPRAKMNQQRSRRFRSAQEMREQKALEEEIKSSLIEAGHEYFDSADGKKKSSLPQWDSNVITPGTKFMLGLAEYVRFYIRKMISTDPAWKKLEVIFSDASIPGEGEHKIMSHIRLQRTQPDYDPNLVHILHGLDADLIMLALATHEAHFYIMREEVLFGRKNAEQTERKREESGFADAQQQLDEAAGAEAMSLTENKFKTLQRVSIPILREYLACEFQEVLQLIHHSALFQERAKKDRRNTITDADALVGGPGDPNFERLIDDFVFLCFFVGNDFLPHLPSLDIRDGALDFLFNVYKKILPTLGDFITDHGGEVNLSHVDVILAEVGAIEDYVFQMKFDNEMKRERDMKRIKEQKKRLKNGFAPHANQARRDHDDGTSNFHKHQMRGRAAKILEKQQLESAKVVKLSANNAGEKDEFGRAVKAKPNSVEDNKRAAEELKASLMKNGTTATNGTGNDDDAGDNMDEDKDKSNDNNSEKQGDGDNGNDNGTNENKRKSQENSEGGKDNDSSILANDDKDEDEARNNNDQNAEDVQKKSLEQLKKQMKEEGQKKLDEYAKSVEDKVRLHEKGWKNRYYTDKCKADDVLQHGGKEHLFRSYIVGLCWVMKYYYDGCPSWKWFYPFHYGPFASDLRNIERFQRDCLFDIGTPFHPVEQLMAVLPEDSKHAIPKASRWLMADKESPILDFYPKEVPCDPNGKAMPWLWVVLLPFIDEDRLLCALHPSQKEWTDNEKLCNAKGIDDGYIYCHVNHDLASSILSALDSKDKSEKVPIEDCKIFGFLRTPLSNEVYPLDQVSTIYPPASAVNITLEGMDQLLTSPIETNAAVCAAFTEVKKTLHKSILLDGAMPPTPTVREDNFQFRRPKLNRGGTIANMGGVSSSRGQSHQVGYGSMNIGTYERELAYKSGRGNQMNQPGTRQWGAMEPAPKRQRYGNGHGHEQGQHQNQYNHNQNQNNNNHHQHQRQNSNYNNHRHGNPNHHNIHQSGRWQQPQQHHQQNSYRHQSPPPQHNLPPPPQPYHRGQRPQQQQSQGYNFQNHTGNDRQPSDYRGGHSYSRHGHNQQQYQHQNQRQPPPQQGSGLSTSVMSSLRSQLASTLSKNRHSKRK